MQSPTKRKLKALLEKAKSKDELIIKENDYILRIDLKADDVRLWMETLENSYEGCNLLLACEKDNCEIRSTRLTWVVGAAIRRVSAESKAESKQILTFLGVENGVANLAQKYCPGLGNDIPWAFYYERHGWLSATPILKFLIR